jgi:hypothetical protein
MRQRRLRLGLRHVSQREELQLHGSLRQRQRLHAELQRPSVRQRRVFGDVRHVSGQQQL